MNFKIQGHTKETLVPFSSVFGLLINLFKHRFCFSAPVLLPLKRQVLEDKFQHTSVYSTKRSRSLQSPNYLQCVFDKLVAIKSVI